MSDIGLARSNADAVLKEFYIPGIQNQLNNEVFALTQFETNTTDIEGRRAVLAINTGRNEGVCARAELSPLPTAGHQQYHEERISLKYNYGKIQLSGPVIYSMASDRGSFIRAVESETTGVTRDLRNDVNRQIYGDGSGIIATVDSAAGSVVTLTNPSSMTMRQLRPGMTVDFGMSASAGTDTIVSVDRKAGTVTVAGSPTLAGGEGVYRTGASGTGSGQKEITGLRAQVSDSDALFNVDPADAPVWQSFVNPSAGAVSEDMFIEASQEVNAESGHQLDLWITTAEVHRGVSALLTSLKRFPNTLELKGGYKGLDMSDVSQGNTGSNECAMVWEKDMTDDGVAYGLTRESWNIYRMSDWEFMQEDGAVLHRVPNTDAYEATLFCYMELATHQRNANAKLEGITVA